MDLSHGEILLCDPLLSFKLGFALTYQLVMSGVDNEGIFTDRSRQNVSHEQEFASGLMVQLWITVLERQLRTQEVLGDTPIEAGGLCAESSST